MGNSTNSKHSKKAKQKQQGNEETMETSCTAINPISKNEKDSKDNKKEHTGHKELEKYEILFKWIEGGKSVCISGSFCKWKQMIELEKSSNGSCFEIRLSLPIGIYQYKFLVDDKWLFSNEDPICTDENGNINNIIDINLIARKSKYSTDLKLFNFFELKSTMNLSLEYLSHNVITFIYNHFISNTLHNYQQQRIPRINTGSIHHALLIDKKSQNDEKVIKLGVCFRNRQKLALVVYYKPIKDNISKS